MELAHLKMMREPDGQDGQFCSILPFLIPALIGAATSIGGALITGSQQKKQAEQQFQNDMEAARLQREWQLEDRDEERAYNRTQLDETRAYSREALQMLVKDAEEAGFNPLTVLRNGGGAGYSAGASMSPLVATPLSRTAPVRQAVMGPDIGGALRDVGSFLADFDPHADDKRELEYRLVEAQIANLNASTRSIGSQSFKVPGYTAGPQERRGGRTAALSKYSAPAHGRAGGASWLTPPNVKDPMPIWVPGVDRDGKQVWIPNPDGPDAEQLLFGALTRAQAGWEAAANAALSARVKVRPVPASERSWLPSIRIERPKQANYFDKFIDGMERRIQRAKKK